MRIMTLAAVLLFGAGSLFGADQAPPSATDIMKKVAESQDREQQARTSFIYEESIRVTTRHTNGKLAREESADYLVHRLRKELTKNVYSSGVATGTKVGTSTSAASQFLTPVASTDSSPPASVTT